ncbi:myelin protein zero-like protein 3 [Pelobates fuscus]|uniref:myelin protein zero-like protein 3 n=1 Tax=Pelobates fuscus TaxID=191477 RepID=UPI002FE44057
MGGLWTRLLALLIGMQGVFCIQVKMETAVYGIVGGTVKLWCSFSSNYPTSDFVTVDWSYRLPEGGPTDTILHYQSKAYPILQGAFKDRVKWEGDMKRGDASISLIDLKLTDNGTFSCTVRNPPDVHGNVPQTKLTVTVESLHFKFTSVILLSGMVFIPAFLVTLVLLIRMRYAIKRGRSKDQKLKKCPIEAQDCGSSSPLLPNASLDQTPNNLWQCCVRFVGTDYDDDC